MESVPPAPVVPTIVPMPEATYTAPPTTSVVPLDVPFTFEPSITIFATEFRAMAHTF